VGNSSIGVPGEWEAASSEIEGVLVRDIGWRAAKDWSEGDAQYMSAEAQAALLGWLWSLPGRVINRAPAWLFYRSQPPFIEWAQLLHRAGLRTPAMAIGNHPPRLSEWRSRHASGSVLSPLSSQSQFLLQTDAEWQGVMRLAQHTPVSLRQAHGETRLACVVGDSVLWNGAVPSGTRALEGALRSFARIAELDFVQIAVAELPDTGQTGAAEPAVVAVEPLAQWECFSIAAQQAIAEALAGLLTGATSSARQPVPVEVQHAVLIGGAQ
jgi:hypothetical protein